MLYNSPTQADAFQHRRNAMSSQLLLRRLKQHHDHNLYPPAGWTKREAVLPSSMFNQNHTGIPSIDDVKRVVCRYFGISHLELIAQSRHSVVVIPRQIAMFLCRNLTDRSAHEIGRRFNNLDHTTVLYAIRKIEKLCPQNAALAYDIAHLQVAIEEAA
jgi:chromosomal replication initiation ATPase DnaA